MPDECLDRHTEIHPLNAHPDLEGAGHVAIQADAIEAFLTVGVVVESAARTCLRKTHPANLLEPDRPAVGQNVFGAASGYAGRDMVGSRLRIEIEQDSVDGLDGFGAISQGIEQPYRQRRRIVVDEAPDSMLDLSMSDDVRHQLLLAVARLADRTAWSMADSGQLAQATKIYECALSVTPDSAQQWLTLVNLAGLRIAQDEPSKALQLLDRADPAHPVLRFLAHSVRARSHARLGTFGPTLRHIDLADAAHAQVDAADLPVAIQPYASGHEAHAHAAAGKALHALSLTGSRSAAPLASERLTAAIEAFGAERAHAIATGRRQIEALPA